MDRGRERRRQGHPLPPVPPTRGAARPAGRREGIVKGRVLVVDDERAMCDVLETGLREKDFEPRCTTSASEALDLLGTTEFDAVVTDLNMRGMNGLELCERIVANRPDVPVIVITAFGSLETAIGAIRVGAYDFITKPLEVDALALALDRAVERRHLVEEVKRLRGLVQTSERFEEIVGARPAMREVYG